MWIGAVTIFPEMFEAVTAYGITGRAVREGRVSFRAYNPRDYTQDRHRTVDDRPYGGGPGMVMKAEPLAQAIDEASAQADGPVRVLYLSPQGRLLDEQLVQELAAEPALILVSGRYEGVDERVLDSRVDDEISIGDYVLSGGELGAMVVMDAVARQLPGVLGHDQSAAEDSFADGLLDCPHYTRPEIFEGQAVPDVLQSGDHERIRRWRLRESLTRTLARRSELLEERELTREEAAILEELRRERSESSDSRN